MTIGVVDSTVIIHVFRKNPAARAWMDAQPVRLLVTPTASFNSLSGQSVFEIVVTDPFWLTSDAL